jgi:hypothetical protein
MATKVNLGTQRASQMILEFNRKYYKGETLYDVYKTCSAKKIQSWEAIKKQCEELDGWNLHITGAGSHNYSCIYAYKKMSENGMVAQIVIRKETVGNTYELYMTQEQYDNRSELI